MEHEVKKIKDYEIIKIKNIEVAQYNSKIEELQNWKNSIKPIKKMRDKTTKCEN